MLSLGHGQQFSCSLFHPRQIHPRQIHSTQSTTPKAGRCLQCMRLLLCVPEANEIGKLPMRTMLQLLDDSSGVLITTSGRYHPGTSNCSCCAKESLCSPAAQGE
jgi:hypothetical protein